MSLGYRRPFTFKKLPISDWLPLGCHVLTIQRLASEFRNEELHQYIHELMQGVDPRDSDWFKGVAR